MSGQVVHQLSTSSAPSWALDSLILSGGENNRFQMDARSCAWLRGWHGPDISDDHEIRLLKQVVPSTSMFVAGRVIIHQTLDVWLIDIDLIWMI